MRITVSIQRSDLQSVVETSVSVRNKIIIQILPSPKNLQKTLKSWRKTFAEILTTIKRSFNKEQRLSLLIFMIFWWQQKFGQKLWVASGSGSEKFVCQINSDPDFAILSGTVICFLLKPNSILILFYLRQFTHILINHFQIRKVFYFGINAWEQFVVFVNKEI